VFGVNEAGSIPINRIVIPIGLRRFCFKHCNYYSARCRRVPLAAMHRRLFVSSASVSVSMRKRGWLIWEGLLWVKSERRGLNQVRPVPRQQRA
jgi:hypothetical protein